MAAPRSVTLHLVEGLRFTARNRDGREVTLDSRPIAGDETAGPSPMELLLMAAGGCAAMDVISVLRKMRQDVSAYDVRVEGQRRDERPQVYTAIEIVHNIRGRDLAEHHVRRAIYLSMARYCPVFAMLAPFVPIKERYEIIDDASDARLAGDVSLANPDT